MLHHLKKELLMNEPTLEERLHEIDLRDFERVQKLSARMQSEINNYVQVLTAQALAEAKLDHVKVGMVEDATIEEVEKLIATLDNKKQQQLKAIKAAVFNCSNDLKQLHDRRLVVQAQGREIAELEAEEA
jgi:hypothetical protein